MAVPLCQICSGQAATYVCRQCGRLVCSKCFEPANWSCSECQAKLRSVTATTLATSNSTYSLANWLFFVAFAVIFVGILLMTLGSVSNGISGGAVILIGPIPIVLGSGPQSLPVVAMAVILTLVSVASYLVMRRRVQN